MAGVDPDPAATARPQAVVLCEAVCVGAFVALWLALAARLDSAGTSLDVLVRVGVVVVPAVLAADLLTGVVHWFADNHLCPTSPVLGRLLIAPFREHHVDPAAITRHGWLEVNAANCGAAALALGAMLALAPAGLPTLEAFALVASLLVASTNQFHKWAHQPRVPRPVAWLQRRRWILSPAAHARHHASGFDCSYCVTTGWLNPLLDCIGVLSPVRRRTLAKPPRAR